MIDLTDERLRERLVETAMQADIAFGTEDVMWGAVIGIVLEELAKAAPPPLTDVEVAARLLAMKSRLYSDDPKENDGLVSDWMAEFAGPGRDSIMRRALTHVPEVRRLFGLGVAE